jgi:hypothetical protein
LIGRQKAQKAQKEFIVLKARTSSIRGGMPVSDRAEFGVSHAPDWRSAFRHMDSSVSLLLAFSKSEGQSGHTVLHTCEQSVPAF